MIFLVYETLKEEKYIKKSFLQLIQFIPVYNIINI